MDLPKGMAVYPIGIIFRTGYAYVPTHHGIKILLKVTGDQNGLFHIMFATPFSKLPSQLPARQSIKIRKDAANEWQGRLGHINETTGPVNR